MKTPKSLYSRLALITSVTLVVGYFVVYAVYQNIEPEEVASNATITSTLMGKIKNNLDTLNTQVTDLTATVVASSIWSKVGSDINYTAGKVGIGTTTPAASLDVKRTAADSQFAGWIEGSDVNNYGLWVNIANTTSAKAIADFKSGNTSRLFVRADGNVGIGTVSPVAKLDVRSGGINVGVSGDDRYINLFGTWRTQSTAVGLWDEKMTGEGLSFHYYNGSSWLTDRLFLTSNGISSAGNLTISGIGNSSFAGNVWIGTTNPNQFGWTNLIVNGTQSILWLQIGGVNAVRLVSDSSNSYIWEGRNSPLILGTSDTERMRIDSVGNVGIGTNAPYAGSMLDVNGAIRARGGLLLEYGSVLKVNDPGCPSGYTQLACSWTRCLCWAP